MLKPSVLIGLLLLPLAAARPADDDLKPFGIPDGARPVAALPGEAPEPVSRRVWWTDRPIAVTLQVGIERQVRFPAGVRLGIPAAVAERLRTQSVDGTVHWLAYEPFGTTRVQARELSSGRTYLLDLSAVSDGGETLPLQIVDSARTETPPPAVDEAPPPAHPDTPAAASLAPTPPPAYDYVTLTRFAAQQLYAPARLLPRLQLPGVSRVPVRRRPVPLYRGGALRAEPYIAWTDGRLYVTAVRLHNPGPRRVVIDPRLLRGRWLARTVLHAVLLPADDRQGRDRGVVFLLSPAPFEASLR